MEWTRLLSTKRQRPGRHQDVRSADTDLRSEFEKDYHRIIGSASFRRLQDKTQVFPLDKSDFIRTRLTHSMEVSSLAKSLGQNIGESILAHKKDTSFTPGMKEDICNILQCAGLIHDIGNPPFGHYGEFAIREWFERNLPVLKYHGTPIEELLEEQMREDFYHFEGNAQALRLVSKLHFLVDENGMNLTYALLNTIIKYPVASTQIRPKSGDIREKKMGYYYADRELFEDIVMETGAGNCRHPLTFILEAADDIAYKTADIEDAFVKGFITYHSLRDELRKLQNREKKLAVPEQAEWNRFRPADKLVELYERAKKNVVDNPEDYAVKNWIVKAQGFLIGYATSGFTSHYDEIMNEAVMLDNLMDRFMGAIIKYDDPAQKLNSIEERLVSFISNNYKKAYRYHAEGQPDIYRLYLRLLLVTDYICGMTDSYAKRLYQELNAIMA